MDNFYPEERGRKLLPIGLGLLLVLVVGGIVAGVLWAREGHVVLNSKDLCPTAGPRSRTVLLLDISDPLSPKQQAVLDSLIHDLQNPQTGKESARLSGVSGAARYIEPYGEFVAYSLSSTVPKPSAFLRICNPGNPDEVTFTDELKMSKKRVTARWMQFSGTIREEFQKLQNRPAQPTSPILETLTLIAEVEGGSAAARETQSAIPTTIILFSDLVQNSTTLSHFRNMPSWDDFRRQPGFPNANANLKSLDILIFYLQRPEFARTQTPEHFSWWRTAISRMGGKLIHMEPV